LKQATVININERADVGLHLLDAQHHHPKRTFVAAAKHHTRACGSLTSGMVCSAVIRTPSQDRGRRPQVLPPQ
jgi:hypothetical protein